MGALSAAAVAFDVERLEAIWPIGVETVSEYVEAVMAAVSDKAVIDLAVAGRLAAAMEGDSEEEADA